MVSRPFLGRQGHRLRAQALTEGKVSKARVLYIDGASATQPFLLSSFWGRQSLWECSFDLSGPALCSVSTMAALAQEEENDLDRIQEW